MKHKKISHWTSQHVNETLEKRSAASHKGTYGTALLLAGSRDMPGAALLSGLGAMRSGVGKLEIGTDESAISLVVPALPEATFIRNGLQQAASGKLNLQLYKAAAIGPGIVPDDTTERAVAHLLESELPLVLDAGALSQRNYSVRKAPVILTPHPGEFERITGIPASQLQEDRARYASRFASAWDVAIVLKGPSTVVAFPDGNIWINPTGNSSLAKGGTGDTLTGMILGMLCCHDNWQHAVLNAVYLHGACADKWIQTKSAHTLLAHELTELLPEVWKSYERDKLDT